MSTTEAPSTATMLNHRGTEIPTAEELVAQTERIGKALEPLEFLEWGLRDGRDSEPIRLTATQAWELAYFARGLLLEGEQLVDRAKKIERCVDWHYTESR